MRFHHYATTRKFTFQNNFSCKDTSRPQTTHVCIKCSQILRNLQFGGHLLFIHPIVTLHKKDVAVIFIFALNMLQEATKCNYVSFS